MLLAEGNQSAILLYYETSEAISRHFQIGSSFFEIPLVHEIITCYCRHGSRALRGYLRAERYREAPGGHIRGHIGTQNHTASINLCQHLDNVTYSCPLSGFSLMGAGSFDWAAILHSIYGYSTAGALQ